MLFQTYVFGYLGDAQLSESLLIFVEEMSNHHNY